MIGFLPMAALATIVQLTDAPALRAPVTPGVLIENAGQWPTEVHALGSDGARVVLLAHDRICLQTPGQGPGGAAWNVVLRLSEQTQPPQVLTPGVGRSHFYRGRDPSLWVTDARSARAMVYRQAWPGVDLELGLDDSGVRLVLSTNTLDDLSSVTLGVEGATRLLLDDSGRLHAETSIGLLPLATLVVRMGPTIAPLPATTLSAQLHGVDTGNDLSPQALSSTPVFSSTFGGGQDEVVTGLAFVPGGVDEMVASGYTSSTVTPQFTGGLVTGDDSLNGTYDAFLIRLPEEDTISQTSDFVWAAYIGGSQNDFGFRLAVDAAGATYMTGGTSSTDFPTTASTPAHGGGDPALLCGPDTLIVGACDAFVMKVNAAGNAIQYSVYLGGSDNEQASSIAVDSRGRAYVTGTTWSTNFPVTNPVGTFGSELNGGHPTSPDPDAFVARLKRDGSLSYATYISDTVPFGGSDQPIAIRQDGGYDIAVDDLYHAHVAIETNSEFMPAKNGFLGLDTIQSTTAPGDKAYVCKLEPDGSDVVAALFLDGAQDDSCHAIDVWDTDTVFVAGFTNSTSAEGFPITPNVFQTQYAGKSNCSLGGTGDAFVARIHWDGPQLPPPQGPIDYPRVGWCSYLGGTGCDNAWSLVIRDLRVTVAGNTTSSDFPIPTAGSFFDDQFGGVRDGWVAQLSLDGATLLESSYLGGSADEIAYTLDVSVVDSTTHFALGGFSASSDFPVGPYPLASNPPVGQDAFVTHLANP